MKNTILFLTLAILFCNCHSHSNEQSTVVGSTKNLSPTINNKPSERFFPEKKTTQTFDTLIAESDLQISIRKTDLDSYVVREYEDNGDKQIDKYRDAEIALKIMQKSEVLLDTVFRKVQFLKHADKGFMDVAIFHNYWFEKLNKGRIEFSGTICEPETDWAMDFHHYFDLTNRKLIFKQIVEDENF